MGYKTLRVSRPLNFSSLVSVQRVNDASRIVQFNLTQCDSITGSFSVNPERDPGYHNQQRTRDVDVDQKVSRVSLQFEVYV